MRELTIQLPSLYMAALLDIIRLLVPEWFVSPEGAALLLSLPFQSLGTTNLPGSFTETEATTRGPLLP